MTQKTWPQDGPNRTEYVGTLEEIVVSEVMCAFYGSDYLHKNCEVLVLSAATSTCTIDGIKRQHRKTQIVLDTIVGVLAGLWCIMHGLSLSLLPGITIINNPLMGLITLPTGYESNCGGMLRLHATHAHTHMPLVQ